MSEPTPSPQELPSPIVAPDGTLRTGLCACGCGRPTAKPNANGSSKTGRRFKGVPNLFARGHTARTGVKHWYLRERERYANDSEYRERLRRQVRAYQKSEEGARKKREGRFKRYGLTFEEFKRLFDAQGGRCAVCLRKLEMFGNNRRNSRQIDHDHATGKIRGILCSKCNLSLGHLEDDPARLRRAIRYLQRAAEAVTPDESPQLSLPMADSWKALALNRAAAT